MDEVQALQKAVKNLYFEKAAENVAKKIKEWGIDAIDLLK